MEKINKRNFLNLLLPSHFFCKHKNFFQSPISDDMFRDKRKIEAKYGVKNAILGFVFNVSI